MSSPEAALAVCRFVHDVAVMGLWGAFAYLAALVPVGLGCETGRQLNAFRVSAIIVAAVTTMATLPIEAAAIGSGWTDAIDPTTVRAVLFETSVGLAWQIQFAVAMLLVATLVIAAGQSLALTAAVSGLLLTTLALTGHAAMHEGWLGVAHRVNDTCHVLAGGAWLGALVPLLPILSALEDPRRRRDAGIAVRRFSVAGHWAVGLVLVTGTINTGLILGRWPTDWSSPYQALLATKVALVSAMTILALVNRYVLVPRLADPRNRTTQRIRLATLAEIGLGLAVIGCVSVFGLLEPN